MTQKPIQIAVVTNQPERAEMVDRAATPLGWEVSANSGHMQPLSWLFGQVSDAVLIDLDLPHAEQLVVELSRTKPEQVVLVMATTERLVDLQHVMLAGAKDFIALPINPVHFTAVIERSVTPPAPLDIAHRFDSDGSGAANGNGIANSNGQTVEAQSSFVESEPALSMDYMPDMNQANMPQVGMPQMEMPQVGMPQMEMPQPENQYPGAESVNTIPPQIQQPNLYQPSMAPAEIQQPTTPPQNIQPPAAIYPPAVVAGNPHVNGVAPNDGYSPAVGHPPAAGHPPAIGHPSENGAQPHGNVPPAHAPAPLTKRMIAIVGLRGGVGRSTIAVNLAMALQQRDLGGVSLIEAHHGLSHVSLMLHLHPRNTLAGLVEAPSLDIDIVRGHLQSHGSGINVLAAPSDLDELVELSGDQWATVLDTVGQIAPMTVVDTSGATDSALLETLVQATDIVVVMNPEIASLRSTTALVNSLYTESEVDGTVHIVLNRGGVGGGLDEGTIRKQLGHELAATLPDDSSLATYAMNRGIPFVNSHARSLLTKRMLGLATTIVGGSSEPAEAKKSARSLLPFLNSLR